MEEVGEEVEVVVVMVVAEPPTPHLHELELGGAVLVGVGIKRSIGCGQVAVKGQFVDVDKAVAVHVIRVELAVGKISKEIHP